MASGKIINLWGTTAAFNSYPLEGRLEVFVSWKRRVFMLNTDRPVDVVKYDEGTCWFRPIGVPLTFLGEPRILHNLIESALASLDVDLNSLAEISQGIMSYIYGMVGGQVKKFYVRVDLEITASEVVRGPPDLRLLLQQYRARLHEAAVALTLKVESRGAPRETIQKLRATSFVALKDANLGSCAICLEDLSRGEDEKIRYVIKMPCDHLFHDPCIATWLERSPKCPLCRRELLCQRGKGTSNSESD